MFSQSRKAQHNSFAHHRANLLFSEHVTKVRGSAPLAASIHEGTAPAGPDRARVTGTLSLRSAAAAAAALFTQPGLPA